MKVVILAGGHGTRITEESYLKPKPMIDIGDMPILWHIMKIYSFFGFNDFIICCGYKGYIIKEYFANYCLYHSDVTIDVAAPQDSRMQIHHYHAEPWRVTLIDTGLKTMTGGRIKRVSSLIENEPFMLTYGDGVADVDIKTLIDFHQRHGKIATVTAVQPEGRFGILDLNCNQVTSFREKNKIDTGFINGGFMVLNPEIFDYIEGDSTIFEQEPLKKVADDGQLMAFQHKGFWKCMDTLRDKEELEALYYSGNAPWMVWN